MTAIKTLLLANGWVYSVSELPKKYFFLNFGGPGSKWGVDSTLQKP